MRSYTRSRFALAALASLLAACGSQSRAIYPGDEVVDWIGWDPYVNPPVP
jgi:beta-mannanase